MKTYERAVNDAAKHYCHMEWSRCFGEKELAMAVFIKACTISDIYGKDYDRVCKHIGTQIRMFKATKDNWYDRYLEEAAEED